MAICDVEEQLISKLEGILSRQIYNNRNQIRYPLTFNDGSQLKGRGKILATDNLNTVKFYSGHYTFGANKVYIYNAIKNLLDELERLEVIDGSWEDAAYRVFEKL